MRTPRPVGLYVLVGLLVLAPFAGMDKAVGAPTSPTPRGYLATALPTLGGKEATAIDIASDGRIVGWADTADGVEHAVLWEHGEATDLGTAGGTESIATAINAAGLIVGYVTIDGKHRAIAWKKGGDPVDLGTLGGAQSEATGVNDDGLIAGWAETLEGRQRAVLWRDGAILDLPVASETAYDVNDADLIVGISVDAAGVSHATSWSGTASIDLTPGSPRESGAMAINSDGAIAGYMTAADGHVTAALWRGETATALPSLLGDRRYSFATDINDAGLVVGRSIGPSGGRSSRGVVWVDGQITALPTLGGDDGSATGINAAGDVVGWTRDQTGTQTAVLWTASNTAPEAAAATATPSADGMTLRVTLLDIHFDPTELTVPEQTSITLLLTNKGAATHTFNIDELNVHSGDIAPGYTVTLAFDSGSPGVYAYYCSVPGHRAAGMVGKLTVTKSGNIAARSGSPRASPIAQASPTAQPTVPPRATMRAIPRRTATVAADSCAGFDAYQHEMESLLVQMLLDPGMTTLGSLRASGDLFSLTPAQYESIANLYRIMVDGMAAIAPPAFARAWHDDVRARYELFRAFFAAMAAGSIPVSVFRDVSNGDQLDAQIAADADAATKVCPAFAAFATELTAGGGI